jgi:hypothetical protein
MQGLSLNRSRYGIVARPRLKAFRIPAQYNILGNMNIPGNLVLKGQYNKYQAGTYKKPE